MALWFAIACGVVAILYGIYAIRSVVAADPGNERMQEIAGAIQEGAQAYLNRQYMTIGAGRCRHLCGFAAVARPVWQAVGFAIGCDPVGRGRLHWHAGFGSSQRADGRSRAGQPGKSHGHRRTRWRGDGYPGRRTWVSLALPFTTYDSARYGDSPARDRRGVGCTRFRWLVDLNLRAIGRRHLHQGCGCWCRSGWQGRGGNSRR